MTPTLSTLAYTRDATSRAAIAAHVAAGHRRLGGQVEAREPLALFSNYRYSWPFFNCARQTAAIPDRQVDGLVRLVVRYYNERGVRPAWEVSVAEAPPLLPARLAATGFMLDRDETLLAQPLGPHLGRAPALPPNIALTPLDEPRLDAFVSAWRQGFAVGADTNLMVVRALFADDLAAGWEFWCAWRGSRPIATIAALTLSGVTQIANVSTLPSERGRGVASALVGHIRARATARGGALVYLHAATASAAERLYCTLGFTPLDQALTYVQDNRGH